MFKGNMLFALGIAAGIFFLSASFALGVALKQFFGAMSMPTNMTVQIERDIRNMPVHVPSPTDGEMQTAGYSYIPSPAPYHPISYQP